MSHLMGTLQIECINLVAGFNSRHAKSEERITPAHYRRHRGSPRTSYEMWVTRLVVLNIARECSHNWPISLYASLTPSTYTHPDSLTRSCRRGPRATQLPFKWTHSSIEGKTWMHFHLSSSLLLTWLWQKTALIGLTRSLRYSETIVVYVYIH